MQDTTDERKSLGMRRCKSAMLARELPPSETAVRRTTTESLVFDKDLDQIVVEEVMNDVAPSRLRRCKSAVDQAPCPDASKEAHLSTLRRCKSSVGGLTVENNLDDDVPNKLRRCESANQLS